MWMWVNTLGFSKALDLRKPVHLVRLSGSASICWVWTCVCLDQDGENAAKRVWYPVTSWRTAKAAGTGHVFFFGIVQSCGWPVLSLTSVGLVKPLAIRFGQMSEADKQKSSMEKWQLIESDADKLLLYSLAGPPNQSFASCTWLNTHANYEKGDLNQ